MGETINFNSQNEKCSNCSSEMTVAENNLVEMTDVFLTDVRTDISAKSTISMPIAQMATLGAGMSSLIPALRTVTQTTTINTSGLYRLANSGAADVLKKAKDNNYWGAMKNTITEKSKMAKFQAVDSLTANSTAVAAINPAVMMVAVALFAVEQKLGDIEEMAKRILTFLETEKESEIEADVETLSNIITKYKNSWDKEQFVASNHKLALDIQRTARKNMISYKKGISDIVKSKQLFVAQATVSSTLTDLIKKFKYYRLSLYIFSMSSFMEIMLSGNFAEENIAGIKSEIEKLSMTYRDVYEECSVYLEKLSKAALETNVIKGIGLASKAVGKFIGSIPVIKEGPVDEFLQDGGTKIESSANDMVIKAIKAFAEISNPGVAVFTEKMSDMIQIYNHTAEICFDKENIYLIAG